MMSTLRLALRSLFRSRSFTFTVIATLAIGIGLNAAIFTVVDCVLLRPLGYHDADRIVGLQTHFNDENRSIPRLGGDDYNDVAKQVKGLEATAYYQVSSDGISLNGTALYLPVANVSPRFLEVMGVEPLAGRLFRGDDADGHDAVVGGAFAREHFGSAAAAIGQTVRYAGTVRSIVGVLPDGFSFPGKTELWIETKLAPDVPARSAYNQRAIGKRRADVTEAQLAAELATFSSQLQRTYPEDAHKNLEAVSLQEQVVGNIRSTLNLLMGSVAIVLLIVCANIGHLQLVRAMQQLRGVTIRTALGASRKALATRALTESAVLALAGSLAAVAVAVPALKLLVWLAPPGLPRLADVHLNGDVFAFSFLVALAVMVIAAMLPVWRSWHIDPALVLRQDASRGTEGRNSVRLRDGLIVAEVALTLTLAVTAILLTRQLIAQSRQDLGFDADALVTLETHTVSATPYPESPSNPTPDALAAWQSAAMKVEQKHVEDVDAALNSVAQVPGVVSVAAIDRAPMNSGGSGGSDVNYAVKGRQVFSAETAHLPHADVTDMTPGALGTMGVPLLRGRMLTAEDRFGTPYVLLINETLAREIFPKEDPVGKQVMCGLDAVPAWWTIVGVVGDVRSDSPAVSPEPMFYVPVAQHTSQDLSFIVRTATPPAAMAETLRNRLAQTHPEIAVKATTMRENIGETQRAENFRSLLFGSFAAVSILLAAVGMYGVTSYSVAQRRFEFGLRFALGANRAQVLGMVLRKALSVAGVGVVLGIALSFELLRVLASMLGKLPAFDPVAYALAAFAVLMIALCATLLPARRASTIDPMTVLRSE